jgi:N-acetylglucosamine kinase-like BadF-type ATPase
MILVADSGSTNTNWVVINKKEVITNFITNGFNPYFTKSEEICTELNLKFPDNLKKEEIRKIFFYGSGCSSIELKGIIEIGLNQLFINADIEINHDLLGAARALFINEPGVAVILGTGASTCLYDGKVISSRIPSLGYILGDEGGGDYLGKLFITDLLYGRLPERVNRDFFKKFQLSNSQIMHKIYKEPNPNRFLASFSKFISAHCKDPQINDLIIKSFTDLFLNNITKYPNIENLKIRITGSIGFYFKNQLKEVARNFNLNIDLIDKSPINRLSQYHINKI